MAEPQPPKKKFFSPVGLLVGLLLVCGCIGIALFNRTGNTPTAAQPTAAGSAPTVIVEETAAPTDTPEPTETPAPTPPPTNTPTPPQELSGAGSSVEIVTIRVPSTVAFTHEGSRNFAVIAYPESGPQQLLVNVIGNYSGTRWLRPGEYTLEITADGGWTATIEEMTLDDAAIGPLEGEGDFISPIFSATPGPAPYAFTHDGKRNFAVLAYCIDGQDLAVNEIGAVNQEAVVDFRGVACFWDVSADGKWSIKQK